MHDSLLGTEMEEKLEPQTWNVGIRVAGNIERVNCVKLKMMKREMQ